MTYLTAPEPIKLDQMQIAAADETMQAERDFHKCTKEALDNSYTVTHYTKLARQAAFLANQPPGEYAEALRAVLHACALVAELDKSGRWEGAEDVSALLDQAFDLMNERVMPV